MNRYRMSYELTVDIEVDAENEDAAIEKGQEVIDNLGGSVDIRDRDYHIQFMHSLDMTGDCPYCDKTKVKLFKVPSVGEDGISSDLVCEECMERGQPQPPRS